MANTNNPTNTTAVQIRGLCVACGRIQAVRRGTLAQHGYTRPQWAGGNVGPCAGSGREPHQTSPALAHDVGRALAQALTQQQGLLAKYSAPDLDEVLAKDYRGNAVVLKRAEVPAWKWTEAVREHIYGAERAIKYIQQDEARIAGLLTNWAPAPLAEVQVETAAAKAAAKAAAEAAIIPDTVPADVALRGSTTGITVYHAGGRNYAVVCLADRKVLSRCSTQRQANTARAYHERARQNRQ